MSVTASWERKIGGFHLLWNLWRVSYSLDYNVRLWERQPHSPIPVMLLEHKLSVIFGLRYFSFGFMGKSISFHRQRRYCTTIYQFSFVFFSLFTSEHLGKIWPKLVPFYFDAYKIQLICPSFPVHNCALFRQGWKKSQHNIIAFPFIGPAPILAHCAAFPKIQLSSSPLVCTFPLYVIWAL